MLLAVTKIFLSKKTKQINYGKKYKTLHRARDYDFVLEAIIITVDK